MASNNTELKIDDDYINSQAEQIAKWAYDLQGGIDKYTAILNNILAAAIMEGATAEALESFVDYVENLKDRTDAVYWLVLYKDIPIGTLNIIDIDWENKICEPGFYLSPEVMGKGESIFFL